MKELRSCIIVPILIIAGIWIGSEFGTWAGFVALAVCAVVLLFAGLMAVMWSKSQVGDEVKKADKRIGAFNAMTRKYNDQRSQMVMDFTAKKRKLATLYPVDDKARRDKAGEEARQEFFEKFKKMENEYNDEKNRLGIPSADDSPGLKKAQKLWQWLVPLGFYLLLFSCSFTMGNDDTPDTDDSIAGLMEKEKEDNIWTAENIVLPHLTDGYRYVSNPDSIISQGVEDSLNLCLQRMDDSLNVEVAMIIVNRVKNGDVYEFAQEVFDRYGIGRNDRGIVLVVAVKDRALRTHTGLYLESDLTDQECFMLQEEYLIPSMKANQPGTGLLAWVGGVEALLKKKQMPAMTLLTSGDDAEDEDDGFSHTMVAVVFFIALMLAWWFLTGEAKKRYSLAALAPLAALMSNPFEDLLSGKIGDYSLEGDKYRSRSSSSSRRSSSGSSWGSIFSGGGSSSSGSSRSSGSSWGGGRSSGYGGGRSGGGGATSRW